MAEVQIFLSYAKVDDEPPPEKPDAIGFVTSLREQLAYEFGQLGVPRPKIWFERSRIGEGDQFAPEIKRGLGEADILIVVLSSNWTTHCGKELNEFAARWQSEGREAQKRRIVVVGKRHVEIDERPDLLQGQATFKFYAQKEDDDAHDLEFFSRGEIRDKDTYYRTVGALAAHLWGLAANLRPRTGSPGGQPVLVSPAPTRPYSLNGRTIFVAKPADDLRAAYERIVRELEGAGYTVAPGPQTEMPRDSCALTYVDEALAKAETSIHLLGDKCGFKPDDPTLDRIVKLQLVRAAMRAEGSQVGFHRIVWAPKFIDSGGGDAMGGRERDPISVLEALDRQLPNDKVDGAVMSRFVDFLTQHLAATGKSDPPPPIALGSESRVYLCHFDTDQNYAFDLADALARWRVETLLPAFDGPEPELRRIHRQNLEDCNAVAVCWANATETWARGAVNELKDWQALGRKHRFAYRGVVAGPPPNNRKSGRALAHIFPRTQIDRIVDLVSKGVLSPDDVRDLSARTGWRAMSARASGLSAERPFPGLRPFAFTDRAYFFGREDQIFALYRLVSRGRFVAVVGSSGSGKSSLVRAGLRGLLADETAEGKRTKWVYSEMRPGVAPLARLAAALARMAEEEHESEIAKACRDRVDFRLRQSSFGLQDALADVGIPPDRSILLVVDQFEELFRFGLGEVGGKRGGLEVARRRDEAAHFVQILLDAARRKVADIHVLITMRSDFIGDCSHFHGLPEAVSGTQFLVPDLTRDQLEEAVRLPVEKAGGEIEPALVERLINSCGDEFDQLPVLQHCLMRIWDAARVVGATPCKLTRAEYEEIGGMAGALSRHADEILKALPGRERVVEQAMRALGEVDREGRATRRWLPYAQVLAETGATDTDLRAVLDPFRAEDCSFITPSLSRTTVLADETVLDIGHEAFLRRWKKVAGDPNSLDPATGRPPLGWLREEERDGQRYRALLSMLDSDGRGAPPPRVEEWRDWWNARPRTAAWAERYGGQFENAKRLIDEGITARKKAAEELARDRKKTQRMLATLALALLAALGVVVYQVWNSVDEAAQNKVRMQASRQLLDNILIEYNSGTITVKGASDLSKPVEDFVGKVGDRSGSVELMLIESDLAMATGDHDRALALAEQAKTISKSLVLSDPTNASYLQHLFASSLRVGDSLSIMSRRTDYLQAALAEYRETLSIAQQLTALEPDNSDDLATVQLKIGDIDQGLKDWTSAIAEYRKTLIIVSELFNRFPKESKWRRLQGAAHNRIGQVLESTQDFVDAGSELGAAQSVQLALVEEFPKDTSLQSNLAATRTRLADVMIHQNKFNDALTIYESGITMQEGLVRADPSNRLFKLYLAPNYFGIAVLLDRLQRTDEAEAYVSKAFDLRKDLWNADHKNVKLGLRFTSTAILVGDHQSGADRLNSYRQALAMWHLVSNSDSEIANLKEVYPDVMKVADSLAAQRDWGDAKDAYDLAQSIASANLRDKKSDASWQKYLLDASARAAEVAGKLNASAEPAN